jgi:ubiquinone biosynthesis protein COQ9
MNPPERSPERDAALQALLPRVPQQGWTQAALRDALRDIGADPLDAELLFPGGTPEIVEGYLDFADRRMERGAAQAGIDQLRLSARVRALIALRLAQAREERDAIRRLLAILALPANAPLTMTCTARTVDAIWHAAGDTSADVSWYTKRAILAAVYSATLLYWLRDFGEDDAATLTFLDRRLADVARIGKLRRRIEKSCGRAPSAAPQGKASAVVT